jgi:carbonic anhydrase
MRSSVGSWPRAWRPRATTVTVDTGEGPGSTQAKFIDWLTIANQAKSVATDAEWIKKHPLVPKGIPVYGYVYQVESGKLVEIPEATEVGRAS